MTTPAGRRESVIAKIRLGLGANDLAARRAEVAERLARPASQLVPERAKQPADERRQGGRDVSGDLAYFVALERGTFRVAGTDSTRRGFTRATMVFRREAGGWKLRHRHMDHLGAPPE